MTVKARAGRWHYRFKVDGKEYARSTGLAATERNRSAAEEQQREDRRAILEGRNPERPVRARRFSDAAEEFLAWAEQEHREHPNTARRLRASFTSLRKFCEGMMVMQVDEAAIERYKTWRRAEHTVEEVTLRHDLHALSAFFQWAIRTRAARGNPVRNVDIPSDAAAVRIHVLTAEEEKKYFTAARGILRDVARLMLNQGCRPGELLALRKEDVDLMERRLYIRKGKTPAARRSLLLTNESLSILKDRMAPRPAEAESPWVFESGRGGPRQSLQEDHDRALTKAGVLFVLYDLRHTFATRMAAMGCPLPTLAAILGHASIRMVMRYVHPTEQDKTAAMLRYGEAMEQLAEGEQKGRKAN